MTPGSVGVRPQGVSRTVRTSCRERESVFGVRFILVAIFILVEVLFWGELKVLFWWGFSGGGG